MTDLCIKGLHWLTADNVYADHGKRGGQCLTCVRIAQRARARRRRAARKAETPVPVYLNRAPKQFIDVPEPEPTKPLPRHRQTLESRLEDPDVARYHLEKAAANERADRREIIRLGNAETLPREPYDFARFAILGRAHD